MEFVAEGFPTFATFTWPFFGVNNLVLNKGSGFTKGPRTMGALLGPFSSVNLLVLPKVRPVAKDFPTFATLGAFHQREPSGADLECNFGRKLFHTPCTRKAFPQSEFSDAFSVYMCGRRPSYSPDSQRLFL